MDLSLGDSVAAWTWTRGEEGLEVNIRAGDRATCCSLAPSLSGMMEDSLAELSRSRDNEAIDGDGEGGRVMVSAADALPCSLVNQLGTILCMTSIPSSCKPGIPIRP